MDMAGGTLRIALIGVLLALFLGSPASGEAYQSGENHAGLVVQFGDGSTRTYCVGFAEESISGLDLLLKTGLEVRVESFGGTGSLICKIGPDGCDYPEEPCVCESYGPGGVYWSYHHLREGVWRTSGVGLSSYRVRDGDVEGLAWSAGKPPPLMAFNQVCSEVRAPQPQPEPTATPSTQRPPEAVPTRLPPTFTPKPPLPQPTADRPFPSATRNTVPSRTPRPIASVTPVLTNTQEPVAPTSTPILEATVTPTLARTETAQPSPTRFDPTETVPPTAPATTATPTPVVRDQAQAGEDMARNIGLGIGIATLVGLAGWGIWRRRTGGTGVG